MSLYIDLTEFLYNPITTGIQRVEGEICRYLPKGGAIPIRLCSNGYVVLPEELIQVIATYFCCPTEFGASEVRRLGSVNARNGIKLSSDDVILVPELFLDPGRLEFLGALPDEELFQYRFIIHDLLPLTHPEYFSPDWHIPMHGYFRIIRRAKYCAFTSEEMRSVYCARLKRTEASSGIILPLGSDSLGPRMCESAGANRPLTFTVVGTIEPRKNHGLILKAFEPLLRDIDGLRLVFIGKIGWVDRDFAQEIQSLASGEDSRFRFISAPPDGVIRNYIEQSRATIYVSCAEGYGLPPMESLWIGTPVIASTMVPSLRRLGSGGVHYVVPLSPETLREAVLAFLDDSYANQKLQEAGELKLPTWKSFAEGVLEWCRPGAGRAAHGFRAMTA